MANDPALDMDWTTNSAVNSNHALLFDLQQSQNQTRNFSETPTFHPSFPVLPQDHPSPFTHTPPPANSRPTVPPSPEYASPSHHPRVSYSDRYIPTRSSCDFENFGFPDRLPDAGRPNPAGRAEEIEETTAAYKSLLQTSLLGASSPTAASDQSGGRDSLGSPPPVARNLFRYKSDHSGAHSPGGKTESPYSLSPLDSDTGPLLTSPTPKLYPRKVARTPFKVLDAPALEDDFYLNLVDWSSDNVLAVGLGACIYLWSALTGNVVKLFEFPRDQFICAVNWCESGPYLAVGNAKGEVHIWDVVEKKHVRTLSGHCARVGAIAWSTSSLCSGGKDRWILHHDIRARAAVRQLAGHRAEVCGLKWSPDGRELASGGNDNQLLIWQQASDRPVIRFSDHTAAVKAIAWSPHQHGVVASGGGTADKCIRFWNTATQTALSHYDTGSQVCNLAWSKNVNEIVSTHGYSLNQIVVWKYPTMTKIATLTGHTTRVLYLAVSPDGETIVTGAGDERSGFGMSSPRPKFRTQRGSKVVRALGRTQIR